MTSQLGQEAPVARATARFVRVTPMKARRVVDLLGPPEAGAPRLPAHQSRTLASTRTVAGGRSAAASAPAIRARAASIVAATCP